MSLQFGNFRFDKRPLDTRYIDQVRAMLARFSPDPEGAYSDASVEIVYRAFHTSEESRREKQPRVSDSGVVVTWDGRLDNRKELISGNRKKNLRRLNRCGDRYRRL